MKGGAPERRERTWVLSYSDGNRFSWKSLSFAWGGKFQISNCFEILIRMLSNSQRRNSGNFY